MYYYMLMINSDLKAINSLIEYFYKVFDNRTGKQPNLTALDDFFIPGGMIYKRADSTIETMDLQAFKTPRKALFDSGCLHDFHEWETSEQTTLNSGLATRISTYQKKGFLNGENYQGQGTKHFQLIKTQGGWKITSMVWEDLP